MFMSTIEITSKGMFSLFPFFMLLSSSTIMFISTLPALINLCRGEDRDYSLVSGAPA